MTIMISGADIMGSLLNEKEKVLFFTITRTSYHLEYFE